MAHDLDTLTARESLAGPGMDTRLWTTFGLVAADTPEARSVIYKDENGQTLPYPQVMVKVEPSGTTLPCRVASWIAGAGEGSWMPFVAGDEVLVQIPEGDERAGATIIGRLNQNKDTFPTLVAGQDTSQNNFGFWRLRVPFIIETAAGFLIHQATTNAMIGIDPTGAISLAQGDKNLVHIGHDFVGMMTGDNSTLVQLFPDSKQALIQADTTQFVVDAQASQFMTVGSLALATSGAPATGHAVTVEQLVVFLQAFFVALGASIPGPLTGAAVAAAVVATLTTAIPAAAALPVTPYSAVLSAAMSIPPDFSGTLPGFGKPGLMF